MPDISASGTPISSGDLGPGASWQKSNAFDDVFVYNSTDAWASSQLAPGQANVAYIGVDFGIGNVARVDSVNLQQANVSGNRLFGPNVIAFQHSDDGIGWTTHENLSPADSSALQNFTLASSTPNKRFFRFLALADVPGGAGSAWGVAEGELIGELNPAAGGGGGGGYFGGIFGRRGRRGRRR